jgi:ribosomal protein L32
VDACPLCGESLCAHGLCSNIGDPWTDGCKNSYDKDGYQCANCGEAAQQRQLEEYYGGSTPQTDRERMEIEERN